VDPADAERAPLPHQPVPLWPRLHRSRGRDHYRRGDAPSSKARLLAGPIAGLMGSPATEELPCSLRAYLFHRDLVPFERRAFGVVEAGEGVVVVGDGRILAH